MAPHQHFRSCFFSPLAPQPQLDVYPTAGAANSCPGWLMSTFKLLARLTAASQLHCLLPKTCIQERTGKSQVFHAEQFGRETGGDLHKANESSGSLALPLTSPWGTFLEVLTASHLLH